MRYFININQQKAIEWELDIKKASLVCFLLEVNQWASEYITDNKVYYWVSNSKIAEEFPILTDKPDTIKRWMYELEKKGLIERKCINKRSYIRLTDKIKTWNYSDNINSDARNNEQNNDDGSGMDIPESPTSGIYIPKHRGFSSRHPRDGYPEDYNIRDPETNNSKDILVEQAQQILYEFNSVTKMNLSLEDTNNRKLVIDRLNEGYTVEDLILVLRSRFSEWINNPVMARYIRPLTIFGAEKFSGYLIEARSQFAAFAKLQANKYQYGCGGLQCLN